MTVHLLDRGEVSGGSTGLGEGNVLCCDKRPGPELGLAQQGLALYDEIEELLGDEAGIRRKGALVAHVDEASWAGEAERIATLHAAGVECELLDPEAARAAEPELRGELLGASSFPHDLQCAPRAIARGLARAAEALGGTVETGRATDSVSVAGGRVTGVAGVAADAVVIAAGAWSAPLARSAGLELPVEPRKGQLVRLERRPEFLRHKVIDGSYMAAVESADAGLAVSTVVETTLDGHVLVGSSRERRGFDLSVDPGGERCSACERDANRAGDRLACPRRRVGRPAALATRRAARDRRLGRREGPLGRDRPRGRRCRARADHGKADRSGDLRRGDDARPGAVQPGSLRFSASSLRPAAYCSKAGPKSGIVRRISGSSGPLKCSRISKRVAESGPGVSVNVRTPLKSPSGIPPVQVIRAGGSNSVTRIGNPRPGFSSEKTLSFSPGAIRPSTFSTPESQSG